jgi:two-component system response regulator
MATVLVVDDVEMFRNVVVHALKGAGHQALSAPDGEAALRLLETARVDLILLDMAMPKMGGAEFLTRLRAGERHNDVPVVVVSATSPTPRDQSVLEMGAQAQLLKSRFSLRDLIQRVNDLLNVPA